MIPVVRKILYATDLSEGAKQALAWGMSLANRYQATLTVLHVTPDLVEEMADQMGYDLAACFDAATLERYNRDGRQAAQDAILQRIRGVMAEVRGVLAIKDLDIGGIVVKVGHPVREILATVQEGDFDLVVMGRHGHGFIDELLIGSVARGVVQRCPKPVLTIRLDRTPAA